jgi:hypothetical protein
MSLRDHLAEYVRACFTGIWIQSHEHDDALLEIAQLCRDENWRLATWDINRGISGTDGNESTVASSDPLAAVRSCSAMCDEDRPALLVLANFHRFLGSAEIVQAVMRQISLGKQRQTFLVILSPVVETPPELEKLFVVIEHELPGRNQLEEIARGIATDESELPMRLQLDRVLEAAAGLTRYEAEGAFSLSLVRHGELKPETIWELKSQTLTKSGLLGLHRGGERFDQLGGLNSLKSFCRRALDRNNRKSECVTARGVLLLSPPGCGKSQFAKALGNETERPTLTLEIGSLMGSLLGQSEQNMRQALKIAEAMAPCVLFCDELEKGLAGVGGNGQSDSGVSSRVFGHLLSWLNDHTSDVFVVATCNDISRLPPEVSRAERFDGVFYIDLPDTTTRESIWQIHMQEFDIDSDQTRPDDADWSGAEIRSCCRLAALLDVTLMQASQHIVPVASTSREAVASLRSWASGRCLDAGVGGIFQTSTPRQPKRRRVQVDPSAN